MLKSFTSNRLTPSSNSLGFRVWSGENLLCTLLSFTGCISSLPLGPPTISLAAFVSLLNLLLKIAKLALDCNPRRNRL